MSEFFLGHSIDRLGYDKSPEYDENFFRDEYVKVELKLNLWSEKWETLNDVEKLRKELEDERGKRKTLEETLDNLRNRLDYVENTAERMNKSIELNVQMAKAVESKDPEKLRSLIASPENRPLLETLITGRLVTDDEIRQLLLTRKEAAKNKSENGFEHKLIPKNDEQQYLSLLNDGWENYGQVNGKITLRRKKVK